MLLVIAATPQELAGAAGARTLVCGIGPREAYTATEDAVSEGGASTVLHVGIAGARRGSGVPLLATVIGTQAVDCDGDSEPIAPAACAARRRAARAAGALWRCRSGRARAWAARAASTVEAMEGFAVLAACLDEGVPALELRVISNEIEEPDRALWRFDDALRRARPRDRSRRSRSCSGA